MLHIISGTDSTARTQRKVEILNRSQGEVIVVDDSVASLMFLEQYAYPSLFSDQLLTVHGKFLLEEYASELSRELLLIFVSSPTMFVLEEKSIGVSLTKTLEKEGAILHQVHSPKQVIKKSTIFDITNALTSSSKKDRWMVYQESRREHSPEALIGILYWKLRQLIASPGTSTQKYKTIYRQLMEAHKEAWQKGAPLDLAIEKVLIEQ